MGRSSAWETSSTFTPTHVGRIVKSLGLRIGQETVHDYVCYCPFHYNRDTPSLSVSKSGGQYICFNPSCGATGEILGLIAHVKDLNEFEALRFALRDMPSGQEEFEASIESLLTDNDEYSEFSQNVIDHMASAIWTNPNALAYMHDRGFNDETLRYFQVGWSGKKNLISVPAYSHTGVPVGVIGRSIESKIFKNSAGLPSSRIFFNLNKVLRMGGTAIIVEAAFDAMMVHQAGYPNVIATIGGYLSPYRKQLLNKYFERVIIMTDNDKVSYNQGRCRPCGGICKGHNPGRELGEEIAASFGREVLWARYSENEVYPHKAKDACDMTEDEIRHCIKNAESNFDHLMSSML